MEKELRERVKRGIRLLNRYFHGHSWTKRIHIKSLDMFDGCNCILGQVFRKNTNSAESMGYSAGMRLLNIDYDKRVAHGFTGSIVEKTSDRMWTDNLKRMWVKELRLLKKQE